MEFSRCRICCEMTISHIPCSASSEPHQATFDDNARWNLTEGNRPFCFKRSLIYDEFSCKQVNEIYTWQILRTGIRKIHKNIPWLPLAFETHGFLKNRFLHCSHRFLPQSHGFQESLDMLGFLPFCGMMIPLTAPVGAWEAKRLSGPLFCCMKTARRGQETRRCHGQNLPVRPVR